jgi:hypothetical protein
MISMSGSWEITGRLVEEEKRFIGGVGERSIVGLQGHQIWRRSGKRVMLM